MTSPPNSTVTTSESTATSNHPSPQPKALQHKQYKDLPDAATGATNKTAGGGTTVAQLRAHGGDSATDGCGAFGMGPTHANGRLAP